MDVLKRNLAKALRRRQSVAEERLWRLLRDRRLKGLKFRRQVPIGRFIADFICLRHRLVVELDGPHHDPAYDEARDAWLASSGFRVLRFSNKTFSDDPDCVFAAVSHAINPSPPAGEGGLRSRSGEGSRCRSASCG